MSEIGGVPNPFRDNVVTDAWQSPADVADIHRDAFRACLDGIDAASRGEPDSLLIYGPAGSGKTHLLTRVQRHLAATARQAPDQVMRCVFVYVRLQTAPQHLWQHVRRRLANDLMQRAEGLTQLQRLVAHQIGRRDSIRPRGAVLRMRVLGSEDHEGLTSHLERVTAKLDLPRDLGVVLDHLVHNRWLRDASAWLAGDSLPERALADLGLGPGGDVDREIAARETVLALCRLAAETLPIVFCFDQIEALLRTRSDPEAFFRFGRLAGDLHDADPNVFLLTCVQSGQIETLKAAVLQPDFDRLAKRSAVLAPLDAPQIASLVASRLDASEALRALRGQRSGSPLYPFAPAIVDELARDAPCVPRRVLAACARRFEEIQQGRAPAPAETAELLTAQLDRRVGATAARIGAGETRGAIVRGAEVLAALGRASVVPIDPDRDSKDIDVILEHPKDRRRAAVSVRDEADGRSLRPRLAALIEALPKLEGARLVVLRDPRVPLPPRAPKVREQLAELSARGAAIVEPTVEAIAALATLSSILADAKSGDLANDGEAVGEGAVMAWLAGLAARDPARVASIDELTAAIFAPMEQDVSKTPAAVRASGAGSEAARAEEELRLSLADLLDKRRVVTVEEACREIAVEPDPLLTLARSLPERCLVLEGPPALLLDMAGVVIEAGAAR